MKTRLSKTEKWVLFSKYTGEGMSIEKANERIKSIDSHLQNLVFDMKQEEKQKEEINIKFKQEFEKLLTA